MLLLLVTTLLSLLELAHCVCQFQTPFYFVERPSVVTVVDSSGQMVADRSTPNIFCVTKYFCDAIQSASELGPSAELQVCGLLPGASNEDKGLVGGFFLDCEI